MTDDDSFFAPPVSVNPEGSERSAGYEFEFTGVEMDLAADIVSSLYGGNVRQVSTYKFEVVETEFGTFKMELDAQLLRDKKYETLLKSLGINLSEFKNLKSIEDSLKEMASSVVPFEIITPPVPLSEMGRLNDLVDELRRRKAKGTGSSFIYAFGMHINPELPNHSATSILNHLRAFVMLDPWIRKNAKINISRRLTPYINEYEPDYIELILNPAYQPDLSSLIVDYIRYDNSRNRPLDLLPAFMYLDEELTSGLIEDSITSARPAYHYRLPNCSLEDKNWTLASEWNRWVLVERLASDEKTLNQYSRAWLKMKRETMIGFEAKWIELMNRWITNVW